MNYATSSSFFSCALSLVKEGNAFAAQERGQGGESPPAAPPEDSGKRYLRALGHLGTGALGYGVGTGVGKGLGMLVSHLDKSPGKARTVSVAGKILPIAGAASGLAYSFWRQEEQNRIRRALQGS